MCPRSCPLVRGCYLSFFLFVWARVKSRRSPSLRRPCLVLWDWCLPSLTRPSWQLGGESSRGRMNCPTGASDKISDKSGVRSRTEAAFGCCHWTLLFFIHQYPLASAPCWYWMSSVASRVLSSRAPGLQLGSVVYVQRAVRCLLLNSLVFAESAAFLR